MTFAWMRRIDGWVGKPLTWIFGRLAGGPASLGGDRSPEALPRRIICAKFIGLGNVVLCLPLLKALKDSGVRVAFWSFEGQADVIRLSGYADEIWIVRPTLFGLLPSLLRSWRQARRFKAEAFIDLEPRANLSALLGRLSGARYRVGFMAAKPAREKLFTHLISYTSVRHIAENALWCGRILGLGGTEPHDSLPPVPDLSHIADILPVLPARRRIIVNVNSSDAGAQRHWPEEHWVELCNRLLEDFRVDLIFPGTAEEASRVQSIVARLKDPMRVFNFAGKTYLVELLRLMRDAELVISVDSGIMHLAAWVGTPLVALFGPETPLSSGPRSANARVLWAALPCSPCLSVSGGRGSSCRDNRCMKALSSEQALSACRAFLDLPARPARKAG
ncbi:MAG: glycosyltransferase family 9 protein [Oligoflexia bacterium]|nr:glycosyltransferase family 9 protein [Oligoflexia bacterium]